MATGAIERYLLEFNDALVAGAQRRERILEEVEGHLRDAAESLAAMGLDAQAAQREAVARFGGPAETAERFGPDPLGRAQQLSCWYEARRTAHPVAAPVIVFSPWIALTVWTSGLSLTLLVWLFVMCSTVARNLELRRRADRRPRRPAHRVRGARPWLARAAGQTALYAFIALMLFSVLRDTTAWFLAITGFYVVCGVAVYWARPRWRAEPACRACSSRWPVRHPTAGAAMRYGAWALALAGPGLARVVPVADRRPGLALFTLALFALLAPLPSRRAATWLRGQRPAIGIGLRATPVLVALAIYAVAEPRYWILPISAGLIILAAAIGQEVAVGRYRSDQTRRRLHDRAHGHGLPDGGAPG